MEITSARSLLQMIGYSSTTETQDATASTNTMTSLLQVQARQLTLSAIGKGLNRANQVASASGDAEIKAGFQQAVNAVTSGTMTTADFSVLQTINKLASDDPDTLKSVLSTVNSLSENNQGSATRSYLTAISAGYAQSGASAVSALNQSVASAMSETGDTATIRQSLSELFAKYLTNPTTISTAASNSYSTEILAYQLTAKL